MSNLFNKKDLTDTEYLVKYSLCYLQMKKIKEESIQKIMTTEENV